MIGKGGDMDIKSRRKDVGVEVEEIESNEQ